MNIFSKNLRKKLKKSHFLPLINSEGVNFPTLSKRFKHEWREANRQRTDSWKEFCIKHGASPVLLSTEDDAALVLSRFFKQKARL